MIKLNYENVIVLPNLSNVVFTFQPDESILEKYLNHLKSNEWYEDDPNLTMEKLAQECFYLIREIEPVKYHLTSSYEVGIIDERNDDIIEYIQDVLEDSSFLQLNCGMVCEVELNL